jgi:hypothetical protein
MTVDEAKDKLDNFKSRDKSRTILKDVHLNGNFAYVSNGRIAFRASVDHEVDKDSDGFPFKAIDEFAQCVDGAIKWMEMDLDQFMKVGEMFLQALRAYEVEQSNNIRSRYKRCQCPSCGDDVYWDDDCDELVEFEDLEDVDSHPSSVYFPVRLNLQDGMYIDVAFGYLYLIRKAFGTEVLFSKEVLKKGGLPRLFIKTSDDSVKGVLMPLRETGNGLVPKHIIDTHAHEDVVKEAKSDGKED